MSKNEKISLAIKESWKKRKVAKAAREARKVAKESGKRNVAHFDQNDDLFKAWLAQVATLNSIMLARFTHLE